MGRPRKYSLDENYFKNIDSKNKAYALGFIYADGSVYGNYLSIKLSKKDVEILEFMKNEFNYGGNIRTYQINNRDYVDLTICSNEIVNHLNKLGVIKNKTYESFNLPKYYGYEKSFICGFFDGDGSIYVTNKRGFNEYTVNFSGNQSVLSELKQILFKYDISSSKIRKRYNNEISCMLDIRGNVNIEKIYHLLYDNDDFSLKRKKKIFNNFINDIKLLKKRKLTKTIINKIQNLYISGIKQVDIAKTLDLKKPTIRSVVQRLRKNGEVR